MVNKDSLVGKWYTHRNNKNLYIYLKEVKSANDNGTATYKAITFGRTTTDSILDIKLNTEVVVNLLDCELIEISKAVAISAYREINVELVNKLFRNK